MAQLAKASAAKPRVLASFEKSWMTPRRTQDRRAADYAVNPFLRILTWEKIMNNKICKVAILAAFIACPAMVLAGGNNQVAATNWLVFFNNPAGCAASPCSGADIVVNVGTDEDPILTNPAEVSICYFTGQVIQANGRATFAASFAVGQTYGCFHPLGDLFGLAHVNAEVHVVLQEHGAAHKSGEGLEDQVAYFLGACNSECEDTQFAIHVPAGSDETVVPMQHFSDGSVVRRSASTLIREGDGIRVINHTRIK